MSPMVQSPPLRLDVNVQIQHPLTSLLWHDAFCQALGLPAWLRLSELSSDIRTALQSLHPSGVVALPSHTPLAMVTNLQRAWPHLRLAFSTAADHDAALQDDLAPLAHLHTLYLSRYATIFPSSSSIGFFAFWLFGFLTNVAISCHGFSTVDALARVHTLTLDSCDGVTDVSGLVRLKSLTLISCSHVTNASLSSLVELDALTVHRCVQLTNFTALPGLTKLVVEMSNQHATTVSIRAFPNKLERVRLVHVGFYHREIAHVPTVELIHTRLRDEIVGPCHHVSVAWHHSRIVDVQWLHNVAHVDLSGSWCLTDIRSLKHVQSAVLDGCSAISDVSSLAHASFVDLSNCFRVTNVSALSHVHELTLTGCWNIADVNSLTHVDTLDLTGVGKIQSIDGLVHVRRLTLHGNRFLRLPTSSSTLSKLQFISMTDCIQVVDLTALHGVPTVHIDGCRYVAREIVAQKLLLTETIVARQLVDISPLAQALHVEIANCPLVQDISPLAQASTVRLRHCASIDSVACLANVPILSLERIPFRSADGIHRVPHLTIESCWGFSHCHLLAPSVKLNGCGCDRHLYTQ
ncbi:Aste57867_9732 [Aphanomyces stellatus]|uniref:Aste57867_9732 protein n=1 Tax=Aphanomyces stellatus TaxID=120398 RepID=A0A485KNX7_9STRA|nr:hypothetical protein As57867_009694 [Aphanomyces stellatus]VFT86611.1 Aste57867_9732 [Aphanomyces stellatus]